MTRSWQLQRVWDCKVFKYLVYIWMNKRNIVIARYAVSQSRQSLIYPLHNYLIRQAVAAMLKLCNQVITTLFGFGAAPWTRSQQPRKTVTICNEHPNFNLDL